MRFKRRAKQYKGTKKWIFTRETKYQIAFPHQHCLGHLFKKFLQLVLCFILGLILFHEKEVWIVSKAFIIWLETGPTRAWIIFDTDKLLETAILSSRVIFRNHQF